MGIQIGCCGFRGSRGDYFKKFSLVEVQHTFYEPPALGTLTNWRSEAPTDFTFTLKAWQRITHRGESPTYRREKNPLSESEREYCGAFQPTAVVREAMLRTLASAEALHATHIIFQCPARFTPIEEHIENLRSFFTRYRPTKKLRFAWEPRGAWPEALVQELCEELQLIHVVDPFDAVPLSSGPRYYRIRVGKRGRYQHTERELKELASALDPTEETYVLFNNTSMREDAERLGSILARANARKRRQSKGADSIESRP